jgi:hypothetical protein
MLQLQWDVTGLVAPCSQKKKKQLYVELGKAHWLKVVLTHNHPHWQCFWQRFWQCLWRPFASLAQGDFKDLMP